MDSLHKGRKKHMKNELFSIGPFTVYGYGLMIGIGIIAAYMTAESRAKKLKLDPHQCLVVEDSQYGIQAGVSAGMTVIARQDERFPMDQSQAHYFVKQLQEVPAIVDQLER